MFVLAVHIQFDYCSFMIITIMNYSSVYILRSQLLLNKSFTSCSRLSMVYFVALFYYWCCNSFTLSFELSWVLIWTSIILHSCSSIWEHRKNNSGMNMLTQGLDDTYEQCCSGDVANKRQLALTLQKSKLLLKHSSFETKLENQGAS